MKVIEVTEWDQVQALERMIHSLSVAIDNIADTSLIMEFERDMACLLLLREELKDSLETHNDPEMPH